MKILVTGANGYLASWLINSLLGEQHSVIGLSRHSSKVQDPGYHHVVTDFTSGTWESDLPDGPIDCIVHLAQSLRYSEFPAGTADMITINISSTGSLLQWGLKNRVSKFVYSSTGNVYTPQSGLLDENSECRPASMYGVTKYSAEMICEQFGQFMEIDIFRIFGLYGPGQTNMLIPRLIDTIRNGREITLRGGKGLFLTPIYVEDAVNILQTAISTPLGLGTHVFNLAGDEILDLDEISLRIAEELGVERNTASPDGVPTSLTGSNWKLREFFGELRTSSFSANVGRIVA